MPVRRRLHLSRKQGLERRSPRIRRSLLEPGAHNLSNQYGVHRVFNNQYGGWYATLNKGYNGANPVFRINEYYYTDYNLTPINSVSLVP